MASNNALLLAGVGLAVYFLGKPRKTPQQTAEEVEIARLQAAYATQLVDGRIYGANPLANPNIYAPGDIGSGFTGGRHH